MLRQKNMERYVQNQANLKKEFEQNLQEMNPPAKNFEKGEKTMKIMKILIQIMNNKFEAALQLYNQWATQINFDVRPLIKNNYEYWKMKQIVEKESLISKNELELNSELMNDKGELFLMKILSIKQSKNVNSLLLKQVNDSLESVILGKFVKSTQKRSSPMTEKLDESLEKLHSELQYLRNQQKQCTSTQTSIESPPAQPSQEVTNLIKEKAQVQNELSYYKCQITSLMNQYEKKFMDQKKQKDQLKRETISLLERQLDLQESLAEKENEIENLNRLISYLQEYNDELTAKLNKMKNQNQDQSKNNQQKISE